MIVFKVFFSTRKNYNGQENVFVLIMTGHEVEACSAYYNMNKIFRQYRSQHATCIVISDKYSLAYKVVVLGLAISYVLECCSSFPLIAIGDIQSACFVR